MAGFAAGAGPFAFLFDETGIAGVGTGFAEGAGSFGVLSKSSQPPVGFATSGVSLLLLRGFGKPTVGVEVFTAGPAMTDPLNCVRPITYPSVKNTPQSNTTPRNKPTRCRLSSTRSPPPPRFPFP